MPRRDIARRQVHRRLDPLVQNLHLVVLFQHRGDAPHHHDRLGRARLIHHNGLEAAGQRRVFLDMLFIFGPSGGTDGPQRPPRQGGLQQVRRIAGAGSPARPHKRMGFIDEHDDRHSAGLHLIDHRPQAVFKLTLHAGPGLQQTDVKAHQLGILQRGRHIAPRNAQRKAFNHSRLADPGLPGQDRVVLAAAHQHVHNLTDFLIPADDRVDFAIAGLLRQIGTELRQRLFLAHLRRCNRPRMLTGADAPPDP